MKIKAEFVLLLFLICHTIIWSQDEYTSNIIEERLQNQDYLLSDTSFLKPEERKNIIALNYFYPDTNYIVTATFKKKRGKKFEMKTNTPRRPIYRQYGILTFKLRDSLITLPIYESVSLLKRDRKKYKDYLFLPIKDATSFNDPIKTHGAGRYLELKKSRKKTMILDFNELFNPYCAYSDRYSCPITPEANIVDIRIEAGEQIPSRKKEIH